jgi:hypothetical protein
MLSPNPTIDPEVIPQEPQVIPIIKPSPFNPPKPKVNPTPKGEPFKK